MACEDYPCCGHEPGDCPREDANGVRIYACASCRDALPRNSRYSVCERCLRIELARDDGGDIGDFEPYEPDHQD